MAGAVPFETETFKLNLAEARHRIAACISSKMLEIGACHTPKELLEAPSCHWQRPNSIHDAGLRVEADGQGDRCSYHLRRDNIALTVTAKRSDPCAMNCMLERA